ncbi:MAG TPA: hypothetical protein VFP72_05650 [Kineosporiaceae bacterium]|nr:hypothetical protein [Kineosporiaceae bacterium]
MTAPAAQPRPPGFRVQVPPSWFQFDAWRATRTADLSRLVDARIAHRPQLRPFRSALLRLLREVAEDAQRRGALLCAVTADPVVDAGTILASLMVFRTEGSPDPDANTVEAIAAGITAHEGAEGGGSWRRVQVQDLPAGRAVRVSGVEVLRDAGEGPGLDAVTMHTLWPVPEGGGVLDVVLTSPQSQLAEALLDLFDAISGTFSWAPHEDPDPDTTAAAGGPTDDAPGSAARPAGQQ